MKTGVSLTFGLQMYCSTEKQYWIAETENKNRLRITAANIRKLKSGKSESIQTVVLRLAVFLRYGPILPELRHT